MDYLASALQFLKGVGPQTGRRPAARRPADDRRPSLSLSRSATKTAATSRPSPRCGPASRLPSSGRWSAPASGRPAGRASGYSSCSSATRTGSIRAIWFNQPFLADVFHPHQRVILFGKLELTSHGLQLQNPQYEVLRGEGAADAAPRETVDDDTLHTGRIVPVYEKTGNLTTKMQRVLVHEALTQLPETLPDPIPSAVLERQQLRRPPALRCRTCIFRRKAPTSTS